MLREVARRTGLLERFSACFTDQRSPLLVQHELGQLSHVGTGAHFFGVVQRSIFPGVALRRETPPCDAVTILERSSNNKPCGTRNMFSGPAESPATQSAGHCLDSETGKSSQSNFRNCFEPRLLTTEIRRDYKLRTKND